MTSLRKRPSLTRPGLRPAAGARTARRCRHTSGTAQAPYASWRHRRNLRSESALARRLSALAGAEYAQSSGSFLSRLGRHHRGGAPGELRSIGVGEESRASAASAQTLTRTETLPPPAYHPSLA